MGILELDCQIVGTITHGNSKFVRVNIDGHEIELPVSEMVFHTIPFKDATLFLKLKNE